MNFKLDWGHIYTYISFLFSLLITTASQGKYCGSVKKKPAD